MSIMQSLILFFYLLLIVVFEDYQRRQVVEGQQTCSKNCKPFPKIHCNQTTGECSEGCNVGYYGLTCNMTCQCDGGGCDYRSGECLPKNKTSQKTAEATKGGVLLQGDCNSMVIPLAVCLALSVCAVVCLAIILVYRYRQNSPHPSRENEKGEGAPLASNSNPEQGEDVPLTSNPNPEQGEDVPLTSNPNPEQGEDVSLMRNPNPGQCQEGRLGVTSLNNLVNKLGVYFLQSKDKGKELILLCVHLKYDFRKINIKKTRVTRDRVLVSEPDTRAEEFEGRFRKFKGTTTTHPTLQMDCPMYWEVFCNVTLVNPLQRTDVLLCIGLCREEYRDVWYQTPLELNCFNLNVGHCDKHNGICAKIYRDVSPEEKFDEETNIENTADRIGELKYGILVNKENGTIVFFDLNRTKRMCLLENVDFTRPLWPVFGVFRRSGAYVTMKLNTGRDIDMTPEKKDMIRDALIKTAG